MSPRVLDVGFLEEMLTELVHERIPPADDLPLFAQVAAIRERFGAAVAVIRKDRVEAAARQAVSDINRLQARHRFVLSHTLAQPIDGLGGRSVLDHERVAEHLLNDWESAARDHALKLSHWRGLFRSYMQAPSGLWQNRLRLLLLRTLDPVVKHRKRRPAWFETLVRHEHLLRLEPCLPYVDEMMAGEHALLADLREYVEIPATSWFWEQLKMRLFKQIASMREAAFRASIESLLELDELIPQVRDDLLKAILERYESGKDCSVHQTLMEFALEAWSSPQLSRNTHWDLCRPAVRQMVCGWLAKGDLEDFYRLCNSEKRVDERRLQFWLRFKDQMGFTQILLGARFRHSRDPDVQTFIEKKKGRLGDLTASTSANNAILMQIGGWLFIEFSEVGTAARAIRLDTGELETGESKYALTSLRHTGEQWTHLPSIGWEEKFQGQLSDKGIAPDEPSLGSSARVNSTPVNSGAKHPGARIARKLEMRASIGPREDSSKAASLKAMGLRVVDNRPKGGALWAYANADTPGKTITQLRAMGFRYKDSKGGFYLP